MDEKKVIHSLEELFTYAYEVEQGAPLLPIQLEGGDSLAFSIHIEGLSWDGKIDKRSAAYVVALQKAFDNLLEEYAPEAEVEQHLVKVANKEGSLFALVEIFPVLEPLVNKVNEMESVHFLILLVTGLAAVTGCNMWSRYNQRKERVEIEKERTRQIEIQAQAEAQRTEAETQQQQAQQETLREAISALRERADSSPEHYALYERPIKTLVNTLNDRDTISISPMPDKIPASEAKKCGPPRAPRSEEVITYADGNYTVNSRRYDEGEVVLELEQGATTIKGYLSQFDEQDRLDFIASLDRHEREDTLPFSMDLQLNVVHTKRKLKYAIIVGEGSPREGKNCLPLDDILQQ